MHRAIKAFFLGLPYAFAFMIAMAVVVFGSDRFLGDLGLGGFPLLIAQSQLLLLLGIIVTGTAGCVRINSKLAAARWALIGGTIAVALVANSIIEGVAASGSESIRKQISDEFFSTGEFAVAALVLVAIGIRLMGAARREAITEVDFRVDESAWPPPPTNDETK